jgi:hypothetical protein
LVIYVFKEPNDYNLLESWDLNNSMLPDKFETKVVENSGIKSSSNHKSLFDKAE